MRPVPNLKEISYTTSITHLEIERVEFAILAPHVVNLYASRIGGLTGIFKILLKKNRYRILTVVFSGAKRPLKITVPVQTSVCIPV